jgi:ribosome-binding protein aMBF1 (putative translation factor)
MSPAGKDRRSGLNRLRERISSATQGDPAELFAEIARQVTERRLAWDLSQKELADLCGTTQSAIARLEAGRRPPRIDTLERVAQALDCELKIELKPKTGGNGK